MLVPVAWFSSRIANEALQFDPVEGGLVFLAKRASNAALALDEGVEVAGRDELVLRPVDEPDELVEPVVGIAAAGVIDERQVGPDVAKEEDLADPVEDVGLRGEAGLRGVVGQDPVAEAVEVADPEAGSRGRPDRFLDPIGELLRGPDVVGQDEDLLREQRPGERVVVGGRLRRDPVGSAVSPEQVRDALDDDTGLAGPGAGDDDKRAFVPLDDVFSAPLDDVVVPGSAYCSTSSIEIRTNGSCRADRPPSARREVASARPDGHARQPRYPARSRRRQPDADRRSACR